jgi:hypothetical protein
MNEDKVNERTYMDKSNQEIAWMNWVTTNYKSNQSIYVTGRNIQSSEEQKDKKTDQTYWNGKSKI